MAELFDTVAPDKSVERWVITVHRSDGKIEVLPTLFDESDYKSNASRCLECYRGVTLNLIKISIPLFGEILK